MMKTCMASIPKREGKRGQKLQQPGRTVTAQSGAGHIAAAGPRADRGHKKKVRAAAFRKHVMAVLGAVVACVCVKSLCLMNPSLNPLCMQAC